MPVLTDMSHDSDDEVVRQAADAAFVARERTRMVADTGTSPRFTRPDGNLAAVSVPDQQGDLAGAYRSGVRGG